MGAVAYPKLQISQFYTGAPPGVPDYDVTIAATDYNSSNEAPYRHRALGAAGAHEFTFFIPDGFPGLTKLVALEVIYINRNANVPPTTVEIDFFSEYALDTQAKNFNFVNHPDPAGAAGSYLLAAVGTFGKFDLTNLAGTNMYPNLAANHRCGLEIDHKGIGGYLDYVGIRLAFNY